MCTAAGLCTLTRNTTFRGRALVILQDNFHELNVGLQATLLGINFPITVPVGFESACDFLEGGYRCPVHTGDHRIWALQFPVEPHYPAVGGLRVRSKPWYSWIKLHKLRNARYSQRWRSWTACSVCHGQRKYSLNAVQRWESFWIWIILTKIYFNKVLNEMKKLINLQRYEAFLRTTVAPAETKIVFAICFSVILLSSNVNKVEFWHPNLFHLNQNANKSKIFKIRWKSCDL